MSLAEFLAKAASTRFAWGTWDCCLWLADWIADQHGVDPAAHMRGSYATAIGCKRLVKRAGGLVDVVRGCVEPLGLAETAQPQAGAIGVIRMVTRDGWGDLVGGICTGPRWTLLARGGGLISLPGSPLVAWEV